ncbi:MAG: Holliday junction branch migration DNA helicase RuvB [Parcubacteria group bacterium]|nr:Holliday junction branch migration DNA helicase RuvB [Parcubacteria group bacterium]
MNNRELSSNKFGDERVLEQTLRPPSFSEYMGQETLKKNLGVLIEAAKKRSEPIEHILIHGPAGLGKTTLAHIITKEMGAQMKITSGAALEKVGDVGSILTNLSEGDVLFIDEVHRLNKLIEEVLYPAMENFKLDIIIGKGTSARTIQIDLPKFTLIAATTRISLLSAPFRSRFGVQCRLNFYDAEDIKRIIKRSASILGINITADAISIIAEASRATPRVANRLLKRVRDLAQVQDASTVNKSIAQTTLSMYEIDEIGLESTDRNILTTILKQFKGGPVGLKTIAAAIAEEEDTVAEVYEPYLMQAGLIARTPRGRVITLKALEHLKLNQKDKGLLI